MVMEEGVGAWSLEDLGILEDKATPAPRWVRVMCPRKVRASGLATIYGQQTKLMILKRSKRFP